MRSTGRLVATGVAGTVVKFLPGLTTVMPPLAGIFGVPRLRFALYDLTGVLLWADLWAGVGYLFSETIEGVIRRVSALGRTRFPVGGPRPRKTSEPPQITPRMATQVATDPDGLIE